MKFSTLNECAPAITDRDILEAMKKIPGYLDITPSDFMEIYQVAFHHALERLRKAITADQVMTREVVFVNETSPLPETVQKMADFKISGLPVLHGDGTLAGVISEKDVLKLMHHEPGASFMQVLFQCLENKGCLAKDLRTRTAGDIMTTPPVTVPENTPILEVAGIMDRSNINRIPVVDNALRCVGIIARSDLVKTMG